jgi:hypothetical protein
MHVAALAVVSRFGTLGTDVMASYDIPKNLGRVRVAMTVGNKYVVWNGKQGKDEFRILCRNRKQAEEVAKLINSKAHDGKIEV